MVVHFVPHLTEAILSVQLKPSGQTLKNDSPAPSDPN